MMLIDILYQLGDTIGWDHCDYVRDRAGDAYGITDGYASLALTLDGGTVYWSTHATTPDGVDPLDEGECPADGIATLVAAWREATAVALPRTVRMTRTVSQLTGEGYRVQYAPEGVVLRGHGAIVLITDDGEVISSDPIARLHVHATYAPEEYSFRSGA